MHAEGDYLLCLDRPKSVVVGGNTSLTVKMVDRYPDRSARYTDVLVVIHR